MKKLRKKKRARNMNRALDEFDDVDESDLVAGPSKRQRIADFDGLGEEDEEGVDEEEDHDDDEDVAPEDEEDAVPEPSGADPGANGASRRDAETQATRAQKEADPARLEKIATKRKKQA